MLNKTFNSYKLIIENLIIFAEIAIFLLHHNYHDVILHCIVVREMVTCCPQSGDLELCVLLFSPCRKTKNINSRIPDFFIEKDFDNQRLHAKSLKKIHKVLHFTKV